MSPPSVSTEEPQTRFERVGRYDLIVELSHGALGPFWAARVASGSEEGRIVCVRRIRVGTERHDVTSRLTDAALAAMEVRHPNILAVLDVALIGQELCVVSEFVEGESLHSLQRLAFARRAALAPAMALRIAFDVLSALRAARSMWQERSSSPGGSFVRCLHGGLSPDSVLVAGYGDVMLVDLGVSGAAAEFEQFVQHPELLPYRAPELVEGSPADERADVFSVGVLVWELFTNQGLFGSVARAPTRLGPFVDTPDGATRAEIDEIRAKLATYSVPRLDAPGRQGIRVSAQIADFVERALERDPARRFQTLADMQAALVALPRDAVAAPEQLSLAMDRLARSSSEERRRVMDQFIRSIRPESAPPESGRPTRRPAAGPAAPTEKVMIPALKPPSNTAFSHVSDESRLLGFSEHEVPTRPGQDLGLASRDARKMTIKGMPAVKLPGAAAPVIAEPVAVPPPVTVSDPEPPSESYSALKPARVVPIGSKPPVRARSETPPPPLDAFTPPQPVEPDALRAAFEAARQTELAQPEAAGAFPAPSVAPPAVALAPMPPAPHVLTPAASLGPAPGVTRTHDPHRQRARLLALVIGGIIALIALIAVARAIFGS